MGRSGTAAGREDHGSFATRRTAQRLAFAVLAIFLALCAEAPAQTPQEVPIRSRDGFTPFDGRLRVTVTARRLVFNDLREPSSFNPAAVYVPQTGGWERSWTEDDLYATISYDLVSLERFLLRPGLHLGAANASFTARSEQAAFSETWELDTAFLWGAMLYAEARLHEKEGPFASLCLDYFMAQASERKETIGSSKNSGSRPEDRDARFRWTRFEAALAAGWRFGWATARAGARYRDFRLEKTLTHHVSPAGASGEGLALIMALDSAPSRYSYRAGRPVVPFAELAFEPFPNLSVSGSAILSTDQDFSLEAVFRF